MGHKVGALLWNRMQITLLGTISFQFPSHTVINTGLIQPNQSFAGYSPNEPPLGVESLVPLYGVSPASRVQVIPMAPTNLWTQVSHSEPYVDPVTKMVFVEFLNTNGLITLNVLFWDPHSLIGPGKADTYNTPIA